MYDFDITIIGWGKAGKTLAKKAAGQGKKVAIIEKSPEQYGGTCINIACLPTKALVESAHVHAKARKAHGQLSDQDAFAAAQKHRSAFVEKLRQKNYHLLLDDPNVEVFDAEASFVDAHTLHLRAADESAQHITSDIIVINTGATPRRLGIPAAQEDVPGSRVHSSTTLLQIEKLPERLTIIGAGFIGLEFASMFANFGSEVHVLTHHETLAGTLDDDVAAELERSLTAQGVHFIYNAQIQQVSQSDEQVAVTYTVDGEEATLSSEQVLVAIGRTPLTEALQLENAGVALDERGAIRLDEMLQTTQPNIYAAGDVKGGAQFTFVSLDDARILLHALGLTDTDRTMNNRPQYATSTFVEPPLAQVGLSEKAAQRQGIEVQVAKLPSAGIPKSHVVDEIFGINKILIDEAGYIVGASLQNPSAHEMINLITLAINERIPAAHLGSMIYTHPSFSEALNDLLG